MVACLSPNGRTTYAGAAPVTRLHVGTLDGVVTLERPSHEAPWRVAGHTLAGQHVSALLFEPRRGGLFAGIHAGGLYRSLDGGGTWQRATRGLPHDQIWTLAGRERGGEIVLYAGSEPAHLYRSTDYGASWEELDGLLAVPGQEQWMFPPAPHIAHVKNVAFDPVDADTMYVGIEQGALLKSTDGGRSWRELDSYYSPDDVYYKDVHRLVVSPVNRHRIYMAGGDGLYASEDAGETWEHLSGPTDLVGYPDALLLSPDDDRTLFMAGGSAGPPAWRRTGAARAGVVCSRDGGRTWERAERGLPTPLRANIEAMALHARPGGFSLFLGTTDGDVFGSDDGGASWTAVALRLPPVSQSSHYRDLPQRGPEDALQAVASAR
ncbi:MAG TPA: glycosyl hydrolase [Chloroflexota bacterium]|nr:glycosyl hydrolase [Chloroflexota bacterium]